MAATAGRQRPGPSRKTASGPGPEHSAGAWFMWETELETTARTMTAEQAKILKNLAREGREPDAFQDNLSAQGAEIRIRILRAKLAKDEGGKQHKPD